MTEQDKVTVDDIIGIVKTEEQTNSVEEVRKLRGRENEQLRKEKECDKQVFTKKRLHELLQQTRKENEQLKTTIQQLRTDNTKQKKKLNTAMKENEQLKIALKDKENIISICEKKFKELGYLITCDDDGYTVEKI